jgi:hypothetical protein
MWAAYKGLEVTIGVDADQSVISNLHADPGDIDNPNHGWNWWEDYCEYLVNTQNALGYWVGYAPYWQGPLATAWYINILSAVEIPTDQEVALDIHPTSCPNPLNMKGDGIMPVAILGTVDFDVSQVDPESVMLEGVGPIRWAMEDVATPYEPFTGKEDCMDCTDEGPDGITDLTLKFSRQAIVAAVGEVEDGDCVVLTLTGNLKEEFGGTAISGEDVVRIIKKGR